MPLHIRPTRGEQGPAFGVRYAPERDFAYLYPYLISDAENFLINDKDPALAAWLKDEGVTEEDRLEAVRTLCVFFNNAHVTTDKSIIESLEASGFLDVPFPARVALLNYMGMAVAATCFRGLRDVTEKGGEAVTPVARLVATARELTAYANRPAWRRWLYRFWRRISPQKLDRDFPLS